jgi:hypothetical protein
MSPISLENLKIGDNIMFTTYGPVAGKVEFAGKVIGLSTAEWLPVTTTAPTDHVNIYRDLPTEVQEYVEDNYSSYNYIAVKTIDGVFYIGEPWIVLGTLVLDNPATATVTVSDYRESDTNLLTQLLLSNGFKVTKVIVNN